MPEKTHCPCSSESQDTYFLLSLWWIFIVSNQENVTCTEDRPEDHSLLLFLSQLEGSCLPQSSLEHQSTGGPSLSER